MNQALVIAVDGSIERAEYDPEDSLEFLQGAVGGPVEAIGIADVTFWINEEGKLQNLLFNICATALWYALEPKVAGDMIVGPCVVTGPLGKGLTDQQIEGIVTLLDGSSDISTLKSYNPTKGTVK